LGATIEQALAEQRNDSPVFEFFPGYSVEVPEELRPLEVKARQYSAELKQAIGRIDSSSKARQQTAREAEQIVRTSPQREDPSAAIEVLKKYRELGAWDDLIRFSDELPPEVRDVVQIQQMLALALNRRNEGGDRDRALQMMENLVPKTGGDAETRGILGRIYKDRFDLSGDPNDMRKAIAHYRAGFEKEPSDYYTGINLIYLLMVYGGDEGKTEAQHVLPRVRDALLARMDPDRSDYWELATALELAVMASDWESARTWAKRIISQSPQRWMIESTLANMARLEKVIGEPGLQSLQEIEQLLRGAAVPEARNA
jgi:tetratricopeptide (TPR) repeat protein